MQIPQTPHDWTEMNLDYCMEQYKLGVFEYREWRNINGIKYWIFYLPRPEDKNED